jgi:endo-1,4-beta-xylanase
MFNRRHALEVLAGAIALGVTPAAAVEQESLAALAKGRGLIFGSAISTRGLKDSSYRELLARECAVLVCENEMKWRQLKKPDGSYNFRRAERILAFARRRKLGLRGHALLFHRSLNEIWTQEVERLGAEKAISQHIRTTISHFGDSVTSWDVVNEPIDPNSGRPDRLRASSFLNELGPDYIPLSFHAARESAPDAELVLNDWVAPYKPGFFSGHRRSMLDLLSRLKKANVPIDALGVQGHLVAGRQDFDGGEWSAFLQDVAGMGLRILVTELDVADKRLPVNTTERDLIVADRAREFLDVTLSNKAVTHVITWGLSDTYSAVHLNHARDDRLPNRPRPYDEDLREKPLRMAITRAIAAAPIRDNKNVGQSSG